MAQLIFHVENQYIHRLDEFHVVARSNHYLYAEFTFSDDWVGVKTALFSVEADNGETITKPMLIGADGTCEVPHEVLEYDNSQLEVSAFCGNRVTANVAVVPVHESGYNNDSAPDDPTPDVYTQIINRLANVEQIVIDKATEAESWAIGGTDTREGEDTDNAKYYAEQASQSATNAAQSETSASESATSASGSASAASASAGIASEKATEATTAKASIDIAVDEIRGMETNARTYSQNAAHSAEEAAETISVVRGYSETASQSARSASSSALDASASAKSSSGSASRASGYATNAQNYANTAERSMNTAAASASAASTSASDAALAKNDAETAQSAAETAQQAAETAAEGIRGSAAQISTNTQNIAANTAQIATNTSDIADLKDNLNEKLDAPQTAGTNGQVLTSDGRGGQSWQNPSGGGGGASMESVTWAALKAKRDGGQLTPGMQYRITDYVCTTTQEETRAVSHPFDIIVFADSESTLNENARACEHASSGPTIVYDGDLVVVEPEEETPFPLIVTELEINLPPVSSITVTYDGTTYILPQCVLPQDGFGYGYLNSESLPDFTTAPLFVAPFCVTTPIGSTGTHTLKIEFVEEYYANCDLEAWELKYCIDNDTSNFPWVDATNGKGVIYYMKDDRDNECSYDFKQIQFKRYKITECEAAPSLVGKYTALEHGEAITAVDDENPVWCYTFSVYDQNSETVEMFDGSIYPMSYDLEESAFVFGNSLPTYGENETGFGHSLGGNVFVFVFGDSCYSNTFGDKCNSNTFGNNCYSITFGDDCSANTFGDNCNSNTFGNNCYSITFGDDCSANTFGYNCYSNTFGDSCYSNTFGNVCLNVDFAAGSHSANVQYYHILDGVHGTGSSHVTITATEGNNYVTYIGKNSSGVLKTWVPADLAQ